MPILQLMAGLPLLDSAADAVRHEKIAAFAAFLSSNLTASQCSYCSSSVHPICCNLTAADAAVMMASAANVLSVRLQLQGHVPIQHGLLPTGRIIAVNDLKEQVGGSLAARFDSHEKTG